MAFPRMDTICVIIIIVKFFIVYHCLQLEERINHQAGIIVEFQKEMNTKASAALFQVVYVTVPSAEVGKRIANEIVRERLAACVNILPQLTSIYEWKGKVEEENEAMLIIKTTSERLSPLKEAVLKIHPYEVPEFISLPIDYGGEPYLKWIREQTQIQGQNKY